MAGVSTRTVGTGLVFTGGPSMVKRLAILESTFPVLWSEALAEEGLAVLKKAKEKYVPIEAGDLMDSGETVVFPLTGKSYQTNVQFGRTGAREYARAIHEHHSKHSPPSWLGLSAEDINWTKPGTGPKYLEKPIREARVKMHFRIAAKVGSRMPFIPGAFTTK